MKYDMLIKEILKVAEYKNDIDAYIAQLHQIVLNSTTVTLLSAVPAEETKIVMGKIKDINFEDPTDTNKIYTIFPKELVEKTIENEYGTLLNDFVDDMLINLDKNKQDKINRLIESQTKNNK